MHKTLYIIRHAKATGQPAAAPLTPAGEAQAQRLAEHLADRGIQRIIASPFLRAMQTAAPLAQRLGLPVQTDDRLMERVLAEGELPDWRDQLAASFADPDLCYPGGETGREAQARAVAAVADALGQGADTTAVVGHGNLLALLLSHYDPAFGFAGWAAMTNPDVFRVRLTAAGARVERVWA